MFKQAATYNNTTDLQEYTETVTAYITKCIDDVTVTKTITVRANQKPWLTGEVYRLLKARNAAFRAGDEEGLKTARANLSRGIREAKRKYSRRIAHRFSDSRDTRSLWQGIQTITDYKPPPQTCDSTIPLLNELNAFFARFEAQNSTTAQKTPPPPGDQVMTLSPDSVRRSLSRINARKAPGPDNIPGRVLRDCAVELTDVFTDIFNISLSQAVVPTCFKATTIIPVPKKSSPSCFNDYRSVAFTPIPMKCFEWLVMQHIKSVLPPSLDPFQFAYRSNRSTDDAIATALHPALTYLDKKDSYVRMLFIAFNTMGFSSAFDGLQFSKRWASVQHSTQSSLSSSLTNWSSWGSTPLCATGCWTSWPGDLRQYGSALTHPAPSHWTQGPPKDVCWAPSSSLCWPTTAHRHTTLTFSLSLRMTRLWWVSLATEMRQTTGARWAAWPGGAGTTISLWMWRRRRRLLLTSGECTLSMLLWPSTVRLWRERAAPSSWVCTSQRTSPGLTTLRHWPRKHSSVYTSSANSEEPEPRPPSCAPSTEAPSRASWLAASLCGMAPATRPAASPFNG